jgi:hypothetical protein
MRKIITALIGGGTAVVSAVTLTAAPSSASEGVNPKTLSDAGWSCQDVVHAVHCDTRDPADPNAPLLGTEFNIRGDLFPPEGRPCPTDPPSGEYTYLPNIGVPIDYYACHRFDSPL